MNETKSQDSADVSLKMLSPPASEKEKQEQAMEGGAREGRGAVTGTPSLALGALHGDGVGTESIIVGIRSPQECFQALIIGGRLVSSEGIDKEV